MVLSILYFMAWLIALIVGILASIGDAVTLELPAPEIEVVLVTPTPTPSPTPTPTRTYAEEDIGTLFSSEAPPNPKLLADAYEVCGFLTAYDDAQVAKGALIAQGRNHLAWLVEQFLAQYGNPIVIASLLPPPYSRHALSGICWRIYLAERWRGEPLRGERGEIIQ